MEIKVPEVGESVLEALVAKWHQQDGARCAKTICSASWKPTRSPWS